MEETTPTLSWLETKNRLATLRYRGILLHSLRDPLIEAEEMIGPLESGPGHLFVLGGLGLGYHVWAVRRKYPLAQIFIYEPHEEIYQAARVYRFGGWPEDPHIRVFHSLESLEDLLIQSCIYSPTTPFPSWWIHPSYRQLAPREVERLERLLHDLKIRQASNRKTIQEKKRLWSQNIQANWCRLLKTPTFAQLLRSFQGIPSLVIGAGPSLSKNFAQLQLFQRHGILWAPGSAYAWLKEKGIQPDLVCIFEGEDVSRQVEGHRPEDPEWMALASSTHPHHLAAVQGRHFIFHTEKWVAQLLDQEPFIPHGGHVTSAAFTMALVMGCNPIIFVGQDLSYDGNGLHAEGVKNWREAETLQRQRYPMTGQRGVVYGHSAMVSYLSWYEESARYLARVRPDLKIINATEGGVRIRGFEEVPLKRVIELCGQSTFEIHPVLNRRLAGSQARGRRVMEKLQEMLQDLSTRKEPGRPLSAGSLASELYDWIREGKEEEATFESMEDARSMVQTLMEKTRSAECE